MSRNMYTREQGKVKEQSKNNSFNKKNTSSMFKLRDLKEDIEVYQIIGLVGCVVIFIGLFMPMYSVMFYKENTVLYYKDATGWLVILCLIAAVILIVTCYHKYIMIPICIILSQNVSIRIGLSKIPGCYHVENGYYVVCIGIMLAFLSGFFINTGYAKDSAFRHNQPIMKKDLLWICVCISMALAVANFVKFDKYSEKCYENIKDYKKQGYMLGCEENVNKTIKISDKTIKNVKIFMESRRNYC